MRWCRDLSQAPLVRNKSVKPYFADVKKKKGKVVLVYHHWVSVCLMMSFRLKFMTLGSKQSQILDTSDA